MADGFIVRKGGVTTEQALAPTITEVSTTETSITFTITNNDASTAVILYELDDATPDANSIELATGATSSNITASGLASDIAFDVYATANVTGKVKSNVTELEISTNQIPAPSINFVSKTTNSITFTLTNNSVETRDVTFGLTTPPTTTTISLASNATSGNQTFSNLDDGTTFIIFAQAADGVIGQLSVTTDVAPVFTAATGGTTLEYDSGGKRFKSHTFTSDGNFVVTTVGDNVDDRNKVDYLIIAGGGSGGDTRIFSSTGGGGGGAGGYRTTNGTSGGPNPTTENKFTVTATTFGIVVGAGGAQPGSGATNSGTNSSALNVTSAGGGGGAGNQFTSGQSGGSGGGTNAVNSILGGAGTTNQGFKGGDQDGNEGEAAGGGGAGAAAATASKNNTAGGNGLNNLLRTGLNETRAGGGGGGFSQQGAGAAGGSGGGGAGATSLGAIGTSGTANTGGGGGGGSPTSSGRAGAGGRGIVVIRYEIAPSV